MNQAVAPQASSRRPRRGLLWLVMHAILYLPFRIWVRTHVRGREHIDPSRGGLLLVNHQSFLDPLLIGVRLTRPISNLARDTLFDVPLLGWLLRHTYVIPISRTAFRGGSVRQALDRLDQGFLVAIYPEGTRSAGPPGEFRPGFLALLRRTDQPVYPVAVVGADKVMPRGARWIRPGKVTVVYGPPLSAEEVQSLKTMTDDREAAERVRQKVLALYESVQSQDTRQNTTAETS